MYTYHLSIDTADDGTYALDCSTSIRSLEWRLGCQSAGESVAEAGAAEIHLDNAGGAFSPERDPDLRAGMWLRLQADDGITLHTLFTGVIARILPLPGANGSRLASIIAYTPDAPLESLTVHLPQLINTRADQLLRELFERVPLRRPALATLWVLGDGAFSQLGAAHLASSLPASTLFDVGISSFAFTAFHAGASAREIATSIVAAERGRLMADRQGRLVFYNRHAALRTIAPSASYDDDMAGMDYRHQAAANHVRVTITPREIGAPGTPLWTNTTALLIPPGIRSIVARYRLANGDYTNVLALQGLTFLANADADGSGAAVTLQAVIAPQGADAAVIEFRNSSPRPAYVLPGAVLYGTPLIAAAPASVEAVDQVSIAHYGFMGRDLDLPLIDSLDEAAQIADFELRNRGSAGESIRWLELDLSAHPAAVGLAPMTQISIHESQTGHDRNYWIVGEAHRVNLAGTRHIMRMYLAPASPQHFWELGIAALDHAAALAY